MNRSPTWRQRIALAAGGIVVALVLAELGLRVAGFQFRTVPRVQFGYPRPYHFDAQFVPDRDLLWVPTDYAKRLDEARRARPELVFLGDSCTQLGAYPALTARRLGRTFFSAGVAGWSSEQGLAQLRRDVLPLRPRVVTIYFGWNDHWVALGPPDAEARPGRVTWWLSEHLRLSQLLDRVWTARIPSLRGRPNRVDLRRYEENLVTMARLAREAGAQPVLITAPSGHVRGREPKPLAERWLRSLDELVPLHQSYVEATRRAAARAGATLCDAAAAFDADPQRARYFKVDGIHLSPAGDERLAGLLAGQIAPLLAPAPGVPATR